MNNLITHSDFTEDEIRDILGKCRNSIVYLHSYVPIYKYENVIFVIVYKPHIYSEASNELFIFYNDIPDMILKKLRDKRIKSIIDE